MARPLLLLTLVTTLLVVLPSALLAQSGTAGLTGTVTDPAGVRMARVRIIATDPATGFSRETETNETGNYNIPGLRPGTYDATACDCRSAASSTMP
jgi:hypothetical protein